MRLAILAIFAMASAGASAQAPVSTPSETGSAFYLRYVESAKTATTVEQLVPMWSWALALEYRAMPASQRPRFDEVELLRTTE